MANLLARCPEWAILGAVFTIHCEDADGDVYQKEPEIRFFGSQSEFQAWDTEMVESTVFGKTVKIEVDLHALDEGVSSSVNSYVID